MISLRQVTKTFGTFRALDRVSLEVPAGTIQGLLGPNGAGKTTIVRILTTLLVPSSGDAYIDGKDVNRQAQAVRARLGVSGQYAAIDEKLTGFENLQLVGELYGMARRQARSRAKELLEQFRLDDVPTGQLAGSYSGGMKRRLDLAGAIVARPRVVILDEPTTGLDPRGRRDTWQAISALALSGATVLLTTQYLEEADVLADSIAVIDSGRIVDQGTSETLKAKAGGPRIDVRFSPQQAFGPVRQAFAECGLEGSFDEKALSATAPAPLGTESLRSVLRMLGNRWVDVTEAGLRQPTLDEVFLQITGKPTDAQSPADTLGEDPIRNEVLS
ncbi:ATP-binding cassette domain-containing protein [Kocuria sp. TGY1127_2]|uniref:ATP-binding cassette domain-containing protein n=1 Tax=Kocuria sp. TGY1127_2 TaxID=2711328 RepID=UPI0015BC19E5|nr:ATP-binding cassette domain-containing protein [Kocuria sp. TGY1127_2]